MEEPTEEAIENFNKQAGEHIDKIKELSPKIAGKLASGMSMQEALKMDDLAVEYVYGRAEQQYKTGHFKKSCDLFRALMFLKPREPKFALGLAGSLHQLQRYAKAALIYAVCADLDPESPIPHYHAADCYMQIDKKPLAIQSLGFAIRLSGKEPIYSKIRERSEQILGTLKAA